MGDLLMDEDGGFPDFLDPGDAEGDPTAHGIVQCLKMLVDEATSLGLARTLDALKAAMTVCAAEGDSLEDAEDRLTRVAGSSLVH
jgi:hypothetical protein